MEPDFSGYVTKSDIRCSDGRTIMPKAFQHMDGKRVPLVWQHGHGDVNNVLGHTILEARPDGMYGRSFFNKTEKAIAAKEAVLHGDITMMSIFANQLKEHAKQVLHGMIREVSLVLSGANPGAVIDYVSMAHGEINIVSHSELEDDGGEIAAFIRSGEEIEIHHADGSENVDVIDDEETIKDIFDTFTPKQKDVVHFMLGVVKDSSELEQTDLEHATVTEDTTVADIYNAMSDVEKNVVQYMIGAVLESEMTQSDIDTKAEDVLAHQEGTAMTGNVFDRNNMTEEDRPRLSKEDGQAILAHAKKLGSFKEAAYHWIDQQKSLAHGITSVETLFPDAKTVGGTPEWIKRRTEWVDGVLNGTRFTPFSRVRTFAADITQDEARAKGYIKGEFKKEEWFGVTKRTTGPTTIYKKQKMDRDDILDITDFDVVVWLKGEIRLMLEEEFARAILIGDGRDISDEDKIKDPAGASSGDGIRSIVNDHELYVTLLQVNLDDANSSYEEVVDVVMDGMEYYKGTGTPTFYTTIKHLNGFKKAKNANGDRYYKTNAEVAEALGVDRIVTVEPMNEMADLVGILVNLQDYNVGTDRGGEMTMFDDFDIDYNQYKYLMETRASGGLVKVKSALIIKKVASDQILALPAKPNFVKATGVVTIPTVTGVNYKVNGAGGNLTPGAQTAIAAGTSTKITAHAASGYYFADNVNDSWDFTRDPA